MTAPLPEDVAIVLIHHGAVDRPEDIAPFVAAIRRGRPTPQSIVDEVTHRWKAIHGSPLNAITRAQAAALQQRVGVPVEMAGRLWAPYADDVVASLVSRGARRIVSLPLAPYSVSIYHQVMQSAAKTSGARVLEAPPWGVHPALIDAFADVTRQAFRKAPDAHLLMTAHSLPQRIIAMGDGYEREVRATAAALATALSLPSDRASVAFQSQGMDGGEWLGPDLRTAFVDLAARGVRDVVVCAIGFLADHTEVLYDLDIEAAAIALENKLQLHRARSLGEHPRLIDALESIARDVVARS